MADLPFQTIGRYEIRKEIGRGMMGVVYEATDPALARTIALKTIKLSFDVGAEALALFEERFFAEARIAARLSHPGIVVVHDVGRDAETGTLYIAMERLQGQTLAEVISVGVVPDWRAALGVVVRVAEALHHAHALEVVHRDLKPANIMLLPSGEPKILDFGLAKVETARVKLTSDGQFFGTPLYMSPEQALGKTLDPRSDLFSLGAIAYNLLTGHAAFAGDTITAIIQRVIEAEPLPPSHFVPDLPAGVDRMIARALAKDPAHRYPDGESMAAEIKEILGGSIEARSSTPAGAGTERVRPPAGAATRPDGDLDEEPLTLVSGLIPLPEGPGPLPSVPRAPERATPARFPRWLLILPFATVAVLLVLAAPVYFLWPGRSPGVASPPLAGTSPAAPPLVATPPSDSPAAPVPRAPASVAGLALDFLYPLENGRITVWIDGKLGLDQDLEARKAKDLVGFEVHEGSLEKVLGVVPGRHLLRVRVAWGKSVKEETLAATFKAGQNRRLKVRLGRIRKNLSLEWK